MKNKERKALLAKSCGYRVNFCSNVSCFKCYEKLINEKQIQRKTSRESQDYIVGIMAEFHHILLFVSVRIKTRKTKGYCHFWQETEAICFTFSIKSNTSYSRNCDCKSK